MRISEILCELGDSSYECSEIAPGIFKAKTKTGKDLGIVFSSQDANTLHIGFAVNFSEFLTGSGDQFRILSTVNKVLQNELPKYIANKTTVTFTIKSDTGLHFYDKQAAPRISKILGAGWQFSDSSSGNKKTYTWVKK